MQAMRRLCFVIALVLVIGACSAIFPLSGGGPASDAGARGPDAHVDAGAGLDAGDQPDAGADAGGDAGACGACGPDAVCVDGTCTPCGSLSEPCCGADGCDPWLLCVAATCTSCGADGEPCCADSACGVGLECTVPESTCQPTLCGGPEQPCCDSSPRCGWGECDEGVCPPCGGLGQPCCQGACDPELACGGGTVCGTCGNGACEAGESCDSCLDCACPGIQDCFAGLCWEPICIDQRQNGLETGLDCGGPDCGPCPDGQGCLEDEDCEIDSIEQGCVDPWQLRHRVIRHECLDDICERIDGAWGSGAFCGVVEDLGCGSAYCDNDQCRRALHHEGNTCLAGRACEGKQVIEDRCEDDCTCSGDCC